MKKNLFPLIYIFHWVILLTIFIGCNSKNTTSGQAKNDIQPNEVIKSESKNIYEYDPLNPIIGVWEPEKEAHNSRYAIDADSIYYLDINEFYKYTITSDSFYIYFHDEYGVTYVSNYEFINKDTLVLKSGRFFDSIKEYNFIKDDKDTKWIRVND